MGLGQDYHAAVVIRLGPGSSADRQVASFRNNKMDPIKFAYVLKSLGKFYNEAEIAIEVDKVDSVAHHLINALAYPRVYQRKDGETSGYVGRFGWRTSGKSKKRLLSHAMLWLNGKSAIVRSQNLGNEIKTLQRDPENPDKIEAAQGSHDDEVMAWMIALWCAREHQVDDRLGYIPLQEEITLDNAPYQMICSKCGETSPVVDPKQHRRCVNKACGSIWVSYKSNSAPLSPLSDLEKELFGNTEGDGVQTYAEYLQ
ncbi:MAG: hypothetical protein HC888_07955 [Candidatus Competibacteraceae bacterium]|nr:hypothetical protein [Candidatus Competibacteraceae bacterium]